MALSLSEFRHGEPCHPQISILLPPPPVSKRPSGEGLGGGSQGIASVHRERAGEGALKE